MQLIPALLLVLLPFGARATTAVPPTIQDWINQSDAVYATSAYALVADRTAEAYRRQALAAELESPWSVQNDLSTTKYEVKPDQSALETSKKFDDVLALKYSARNSFQVELDVSTDHSMYTNAPIFGYPESDNAYATTLRLSYDILKGESRSPLYTVAKTQYYGYEKNRFTQKSDNINKRIQFMQLMLDLYTANCKIKEFKNAEETVAQTVADGRLKLKVKAIGYKDFLTFADLENTFARRRTLLESNLADYQQQLIAFGDATLLLSKTLETNKWDCRPRLTSELNIEHAHEDAQHVVQNHPSQIAADAAVQAAIWQKRSADLVDDVSLRPFVQAQYNKNLQDPRSFASGAVGLSLLWQIGGDATKAGAAAANVQLTAARLDVERNKQELTSHILSLETQTESQKTIISVLQKSVQTSQDLIKSLDALKLIGQTDSLAFANANINLLDSITSLIDSWDTLEKASYELQIYGAKAALE